MSGDIVFTEKASKTMQSDLPCIHYIKEIVFKVGEVVDKQLQCLALQRNLNL